eukprot:TRINITY_DN439_c0_g2_i1.p1 TRINITY_DN439_c0_g2~~TRINITY_DN439_c0_g2_i1.p1  ORF type:complete len:346 (-),score=89.92 TRINITY_DN439_c0_g2_i1:1778-2815(-)
MTSTASSTTTQKVMATDSKEKASLTATASKNRLYMRWEFTDENLKKMLGTYGKINDCRVVRGRCFGFCTFDTEAEAEKALKAVNGQNLSSPMTVEVATTERTNRRNNRRRNQSSDIATSNAEEETNAEEKKERRTTRRPPRRTNNTNTNNSDNTNNTDEKQTHRMRRNRRVYKPTTDKDSTYGTLVKLTPDPLQTELPTEAKLIEFRAAPSFRNATKVTQVARLVLTAGFKNKAFSSDFKLGPFSFKLLSIKVTTRDRTRVSCRIAFPAAEQLGDTFMSAVDKDVRTRNFILKKGSSNDGLAYFLCVDNINVDPVTGLWKELVLTLCNAEVPERKLVEQDKKTVA